MGVNGLWSILASTQEYRPLAKIGGQILAIDLSIWICGDKSVAETNNNTRHLRY